MPDPADRDLDLHQDMDFQQREWSFQRAAWVAALAFLACAVVGLFGSGPLSSATARGPGISVHYDRFGRWTSRLTARVDVAPAHRGEPLQFWIDQRFVNQIRIDRIVPEPADTRSDGARIIYVFASASPPPAERGSPGTIIVHYEPMRLGSLHGRMGVGSDWVGVTFSQFIFP